LKSEIDQLFLNDFFFADGSLIMGRREYIIKKKIKLGLKHSLFIQNRSKIMFQLSFGQGLSKQSLARPQPILTPRENQHRKSFNYQCLMVERDGKQRARHRKPA